ncbi:uncharacterized protein LOC125314175 [Rhodamnia argentea]|uniref:Uncharacterized protein LOC125314175 n=1 Tax=Rhodamnia argentea TaxID=178133 RepID=A0ABM3H4U1_9MYRT|nr:uncharacterized protein LOC125314175 [Rhodamnia argentea]
MGQSSCFNVHCPGAPFRFARSVISYKTLVKDCEYMQDPKSGLWWLEPGEDSIVVGFWPRRIFSRPGLQDLATYMEWGGQVYSPPEEKSPLMGRGEFLDGIKTSASCQDITTITEAHDQVPAVDTQEYSDRPKNHLAQDMGYVKAPLRHYMCYGGPGGATGWAW